MTESQDPRQGDRAGVEEPKTDWFPKGTEPQGVEDQTRADQRHPSPGDDATAEPDETRATLDYVPTEGDRPALADRADRRALPTVPGYELLGELGRGAMGVVYWARQKQLKRFVALKMVLAGSHAGPGEFARFQTEAEAVAQLQHPNVVQIHEVGEHEGVPYFSLEFVDGQSLEKKLGGKPLETAEAAQMMETMARAIQHAHQQGIVHRDLKPANVLLTSEGVPKISDFGLAKRLEDDSGQTKTGAIVGTPSYMAPEQARGATKQIGPLADVYALGAVLYAMLTGRPPFVAANPVDTVMQVLNEEPVAPSRLQPKVPRDLETICLKCLQKDPHKRYADAQELAEDLCRFRDGRPIQARPVGVVERVGRWCLRNPRIAVPSAAAGLLGLALMIGGPVAALVIYEQKEIAEGARREAVENEKKANNATGEAIQAKEESQRNEQEAIEARGLAARQGQLALDTLSNLIHEVQSQLENRPQLQGMRQRLLRTALDGLDGVATRGVDARQRDATMAGAYRRMGDIYLELGQSGQSLTHYQVYRAILEELDAEGKVPRPHGNLSFCYSKVGEAARRAGNPSLAEDYFVRALDIRRDWAKSEPGNDSIPQDIAESLGRLGNVSLMLGRVRKAQGYYVESLQLREKWLQKDPTNRQAQQELAGANSAVGKVSLRLGNLKDAETYSRKALELIEQLYESDPQNRTHRWNLALFSNQRGAVQLMAGKAKEALEDYTRALPILQELSDDDPQYALLRRNLAETRYGIATAYLRLNDPAAGQHYEACLELRRKLADDDPTSEAEQTGLALSLGRCGHHQEAAEIAEGLRDSDDAHVLYLLATGYAVCAASVQHGDADEAGTAQLHDRYGNLAVEALRSAIDHGYQVSVEMELDPDFDGIRQRADFQELLRSSKAPEAGAADVT